MHPVSFAQGEAVVSASSPMSPDTPEVRRMLSANEKRLRDVLKLVPRPEHDAIAGLL